MQWPSSAAPRGQHRGQVLAPWEGRLGSTAFAATLLPLAQAAEGLGFKTFSVKLATEGLGFKTFSIKLATEGLGFKTFSVKLAPLRDSLEALTEVWILHKAKSAQMQTPISAAPKGQQRGHSLLAWVL